MYIGTKRKNGLNDIPITETRTGGLIAKTTELIKEAIRTIQSVNVNKAVQAIKSKLSSFGKGISAGESVILDAKLPIAVIEGLNSIGIDITDLRAIENKWVMAVEIPEIDFYNLEPRKDAVIANIKSNVPNNPFPNISRLEDSIQSIDRFRDNVAERIERLGGYFNVFSDGRGQATLEQLRELVKWAKAVRGIPNMYLILDDAFAKWGGTINAKANETVRKIKDMIGEVRDFAIVPRDVIVSSLVVSVLSAYDKLQQGLNQQEQVLTEIVRLYDGIKKTAVEVSGESVSDSENPDVLLAKIKDNALRNRKLLDDEIGKIKAVIAEILKSLS